MLSYAHDGWVGKINRVWTLECTSLCMRYHKVAGLDYCLITRVVDRTHVILLVMIVIVARHPRAHSSAW